MPKLMLTLSPLMDGWNLRMSYAEWEALYYLLYVPAESRTDAQKRAYNRLLVLLEDTQGSFDIEGKEDKDWDKLFSL